MTIRVLPGAFCHELCRVNRNQATPQIDQHWWFYNGKTMNCAWLRLGFLGLGFRVLSCSQSPASSKRGLEISALFHEYQHRLMSRQCCFENDENKLVYNRFRMLPWVQGPNVDWSVVIMLSFLGSFKKCARRGWSVRCFVAMGVIHPDCYKSIGFIIYVVLSEGRLAPPGPSQWPIWQLIFPIKSNRIWWISLAEGQGLFNKHWKTIIILMMLVERVWAWLITSRCITPQFWVSPRTNMGL